MNWTGIIIVLVLLVLLHIRSKFVMERLARERQLDRLRRHIRIRGGIICSGWVVCAICMGLAGDPWRMIVGLVGAALYAIQALDPEIFYGADRYAAVVQGLAEATLAKHIRGILLVLVVLGLFAGGITIMFVKARHSSQQNYCINNLRQIDAAKSQYGIDYGLDKGDTLTLRDLVEVADYMKKYPVCYAVTGYYKPNTDYITSQSHYEVGVLGRKVRCKIFPEAHRLISE